MSATMAASQGLSRSIPNDEISEMSHSVRQLGFWSAVLATLFSTAYGLALILMFSSTATRTDTAAGWQGIESFATTFQSIQMLPLVPSLLLAPTFIVLMVCLYYYAEPDKKVWSHLGIAIGLIYAVMASINYLLQLTVVRSSILNKETDGLAMFVMGNPHSIAWGLAYAYLFMNLAMLFAAPVFRTSPLEKRTRLLFLLNGASIVLTIAAAVLDSTAFYLLGSLLIWCPLFAAATASVALLFRRRELNPA